eukprot:gene8298-9857_t
MGSLDGFKGEVEDGCTVLHWASEKGRVDVVDLLLEAGANANALDEDNWTPLHLAVQHTHEEVTNALLMADADTNIQTKWGHTPLHWAAMYGIEGLVQLLLDHNASTTTLSKTAKLPRDIAIQNNHDAVLALLDGKVQQTEDVWAMFDMKQFERLGTFGKLDLGDVFPRDPVNPAPL